MSNDDLVWPLSVPAAAAAQAAAGRPPFDATAVFEDHRFLMHPDGRARCGRGCAWALADTPRHPARVEHATHLVEMVNEAVAAEMAAAFDGREYAAWDTGFAAGTAWEQAVDAEDLDPEDEPTNPFPIAFSLQERLEQMQAAHS